MGQEQAQVVAATATGVPVRVEGVPSSSAPRLASSSNPPSPSAPSRSSGCAVPSSGTEGAIEFMTRI